MAFSIGKWVGDQLFLAGITAADRHTGRVIAGYADLPPDVAKRLGTGLLVTDAREGPIVAQAWFVFDQIQGILKREGLGLEHIVRMEQFLTHMDDYPAYNRVRQVFFPADPPAGTLVEVTALLPTDDVRLEVQVTASRQIPKTVSWSDDPGRW
ncbi:MAG: RidA family protein [Candidatus Dormibacteraeota bacterium]|nr:RidA family protein [Candidatus Dormibacteraeota bacterium]